MNVLVLNGSPKGEKSNTIRITGSFLEGLNVNRKNTVEIIDISKANINHCLGCFVCWTKTSGKCVINDDMSEFIEKYIKAELIIWSFPLYYFGMPSKIKAFLDRMLPTNLPAMNMNEDGTSEHPRRYDLSHQRHVLISSCGFYSIKGNYEALFKQFEIMFDNNLTKIICPEGELLGVSELSIRIDEYLSVVKKAGEEYFLQGSFSEDTQNKLNTLLYPPKVFIEMANIHHDIMENSSSEKVDDKSYNFLRQMTVLYNAEKYEKDIVIEMYFTDLDNTYQLLLGKEKCTLKTDDFLPYTTRIETPFEIWLKISKGEVDGSEAMMKKQYKVLGDFDTMIKMDDFFGSQKPAAIESSDSRKSSNMLLLLLPFISLWVLLPINFKLGALAGILVSGLMTILYFWWKPTPYERIGAFSVTLIGLLVFITGGAAWQYSLPFFVSGVLWLASSFLRIPVTAYYSCKNYGGEMAFEIPLFIRTNRILTVIWSIAYLFLGITELFIIGGSGSMVFEIFIWIFTTLLGIFTVWFAKWYPAKTARG